MSPTPRARWPRRLALLGLLAAIAPAGASPAVHAAAAAAPAGPAAAVATEVLPERGPPPEQATLQAQIDWVLSDPFLATAQVGIAIVDSKDGKTVYSHQPDTPLNPASNVKLVTTAAALSILGPEYRFPTRLYRNDGALSGAGVAGDVYLVGSGDPDLVTANLYELASDLYARGIRRIGGITVDTSRFDRDELPPGYDQKDEFASYRALSGATSVNFNTYVVRARPGDGIGQKALAGVDPPVASVKLVNATTTVEGRRNRLRADVDEKRGVTTLTLSGEIGIDAPTARYRYPITDPARYAGEVFAVVLKQRGIRIGRRKIKTGSPPRDARILGTHWSPPLSVLVRSVNKFSNNFMAEQILKAISDPAAPATFAGATTRVREYLEQIGVPADGLMYKNGSGLYDNNRLSATQLTHLLGRAQADFRYGSDFLASMAVMGVDGTTRRRLRESTAKRWVRAKTGTLDGISALSGYAGAPGRPPVAFSILMNGLQKGDTGKARAAQNLIAELVAQYAAGQTVKVELPPED